MAQEVINQHANNEMRDLAERYKGLITLRESKAQKIEGTDVCMVTLPCTHDGKHVLILALDV
jgi:hypothetical protein